MSARGCLLCRSRPIPCLIMSDDHVSPEIVVEKEAPNCKRSRTGHFHKNSSYRLFVCQQDSTKITSLQVSNDTTPLLAKEDAQNEDGNVAKPHPRTHPRTILTKGPYLESHLFDRYLFWIRAIRCDLLGLCCFPLARIRQSNQKRIVDG
jgi:hypothetical protein